MEWYRGIQGGRRSAPVQWGTAAAMAVSLVLSACVQEREEGAVSSVDLEAELMEADRAFDRATQTGGTDAWTSFFELDGAMIHEGVGEIRGREAIRERMQGAFDEGRSLRWAPDRAMASADGTLGFTTGGWTSRVTSEEGEVSESRGLYVSIWRRQPDGGWLVVMDLGNPVAGDGG